MSNDKCQSESRVIDAASRFGRAIVIASLCAASTAVWSGPTVTYDAIDLVDVTPGNDLWRYDYVANGPLTTFASINLIFAPTQFADLTDESSDAGLSALVTQPDPDLPADGLLSLTALDPLGVGSSANAGVSFVWLGAGTPGAQPFEVLDADFNIIGGGTTAIATNGVPEPSSIWLALSGALLAYIPIRRRRNESSRL